MSEKRIGEYYLSDKVLGEGSFSTVYLGYGANDEKVAVKVIPRHTLEHYPSTIQREVAILKKCKHKTQRVVQLLDIKKTQSNMYIFLEYCEGGNLASYLQNHPGMEQHQVMKLFLQILQGLTYLRKIKCIHRDLKPENIMIKNGNIKIADFGLSKTCEKEQLMTSLAGSPLNMAPEILKGQPYCEKVDLYSLGTILYRLLYGVEPFGGRNERQILCNIQNRKFNESKKNIKISKQIRNILDQLLEPTPSNRPTFGELHAMLQAYTHSQSQKKVKYYEEMIKKTTYYSVFGSLTAQFFSQCWENTKKDPLNIDMRLCSKLICQITS